MTEVTREQALAYQTAWYWLMRDVGEQKVFQAVEFDMGDWGTRLPVAERKNVRIETPEPWCGTAACAAGYLAFSGIIEQCRAYVSRTRNIGVQVKGFPDVFHPGGLGEVIGMSGSEWNYITMFTYDYSTGERPTALAVANRIAEVIANNFGVHVAKTTRPPAMPYDGRSKAFDRTKKAA